MKISRSEIEKLANTINIEVSEEEITNIESSIKDITERLDQLLKEDLKTEECKINATENVNQFDTTHDNEAINDEHMRGLNNFDGEFIEVKKVIGDE